MSRAGWSIRDMDAGTLPAVAGLEQVCFSHPWSEDSLRGYLDNPRAVFRVALLDGQAVGYAGMLHILDEGHIANIAVAPAFRRLGVARSLLEDLLQYARREGMVSLLLEVRASNCAAIALYESMGFQAAGLRRGYYQSPTEDALLMTLSL